MPEPFIGEIRTVGFNYAPEGWAFCDGQLLSISQYNALFALLGTTYGGDGRTNFALPDLRGRAPVGMGPGHGLTPVRQGEMAGMEEVTLQSSQMPAHNHGASQVSASVAVPATTASGNTAAEPSTNSVLGPVAAGGREGSLYSTDNADVTLKPFDASVGGETDMAGGGRSVPIRNPFIGLNFIIALNGIFPPRS